MLSKSRTAAALATAAGILCTAQVAVSDESGLFTQIGSMVHDYTTIEHGAGTVWGGVSKGTSTVVESSGEPFVAGDHNAVTCVVYGKKSAAGTEIEAPCTSNAAEGDKLYTLSKRSEGDVEEGGGGGGVLELPRRHR